MADVQRAKTNGAIGGNVLGVFQGKACNAKNSIGERVESWQDVISVMGYLDYMSGQDAESTFGAKIAETTHLFLCDYFNVQGEYTGWEWDTFEFTNDIPITSSTEYNITAENARLVINDKVYEVLHIDDPMGMHDHLEIYLKYIGGGMLGS